MFERYGAVDETVDDSEMLKRPEKSGNIFFRFWNSLLFMWIKPLLELGNKQPLDFDNLFELEDRDKAENVCASFDDAWKKQRTMKKDKPSLVMAYFHAFGTPFMMAGGLKLIHDVLIFVGPYLLNRIILFLDDPSEPLGNGFLYVLGLFLSNLIMSLCLRQYFFHCYCVGMRLRSSVITSVFAKALKISVGVLSRRSVGEISNLMSVDSTRLQTLTTYLHAVWYSFIQIGLALYFLWGQVGVACMGGTFVLFTYAIAP
jgi:ATP-binding cassette, subfamily C (CFTR/MRP), member 1